MDINLPGMSGYEALQQLQDNPVLKDIPVIAISANALDSDVDKGLEAGFQNYIVKPFSLAYFFEIIDQYIGQGEKT